MTPYSGWECEVCKGGNPAARNRCRKCGRKRADNYVLKTFYRAPRKPVHERVRPIKKKVTRVSAKKNP